MVIACVKDKGVKNSLLCHDEWIRIKKHLSLIDLKILVQLSLWGFPPGGDKLFSGLLKVGDPWKGTYFAPGSESRQIRGLEIFRRSVVRLSLAS